MTFSPQSPSATSLRTSTTLWVGLSLLGLSLLGLSLLGLWRLAGRPQVPPPSAPASQTVLPAKVSPPMQPPAPPPAPMARPVDPVDLAGLFAAASVCGDRYHCPPLATLCGLAAQPPSAAELPPVVRAALAIWGRAQLPRDATDVRVADAVLRSFAEALTESGDRHGSSQRLCDELGQLLERGQPAIRPTVYAFLGSPGAFQVAGAVELLQHEVERGDRTAEDVIDAGRSLAPFAAALPLAQRWLHEGPLHEVRAAAGVLTSYGAETPEQAALARQLLHRLARHPRLPADAAHLLLQRFAESEDAAFAPALRVLLRHPDATVREHAKSVSRELH